MDLEQMIDGYNELRERCLKLARDYDLFGASEWLRHAISASDITLEHHSDGIYCYGSTYTVQTMDHEHFEFTIPHNLASSPTT